MEIVFLSQVTSDHHQIALVDAAGSDTGSGSLDHIAFRVASIGDVREMTERVQRDERTSDIATVTHGNAWSVYFRDPEGNRLEVFCDTPWYVQQPVVEPWDPDLNDDELLAETKRAFSGRPGFAPLSEWESAQLSSRRRGG
jgi:catechol-2,3-dioxygenase